MRPETKLMNVRDMSYALEHVRRGGKVLLVRGAIRKGTKIIAVLKPPSPRDFT